MKTEEMLNLTVKDLNKLKTDEIRGYVKILHRTADARLKNLRKIAGEVEGTNFAGQSVRKVYVPALQELETKRGVDYTFSSKNLDDMNVNILRAEFMHVKMFLKEQTSTVSGFKKWNQKAEKNRKRLGINDEWTYHAQDTWVRLLRNFMELNQKKRYLNNDSKLYHELKEYVQKMVKGFNFERDIVTSQQLDIWREKLQAYAERRNEVRYKVLRDPNATQDYLGAFGIAIYESEKNTIPKSGSNLGKVAYNFNYDYNGRWFSSKDEEKRVKANVKAKADKAKAKAKEKAKATKAKKASKAKKVK